MIRINKCIGFLSCWIYAAFMVSNIFNTFLFLNFLFSADDALYFLKTLCESVNISNQITPIRPKIKNSTESAQVPLVLI